MAEPPPEQPNASSSIDTRIFGTDGGLRPEHPLLRRAQEGLKAQFEANRQRLEDELREKSNALQVPTKSVCQ